MISIRSKIRYPRIYRCPYWFRLYTTTSLTIFVYCVLIIISFVDLIRLYNLSFIDLMRSAYRLYSSKLKREIIVYLSRDLLISLSLALIYYLINTFTFLSIRRSIYMRLRYSNIIRYSFRFDNISFFHI